MANESLSLLHISDIHFKKLEFDIDFDLRNELERDARELKEKQGSIQGILVSGDIAFSGKVEEYNEALNWLEKFTNQLNCSPSNIWSIPGNHDVQWEEIDSRLQLREMREKLRSTEGGKVDSLIEDYFRDQGYREVMYKPIHNYVHVFASKFNCDLDVDKPFVDHPLKLNDGSTLKIRGINSTLVSYSNDLEKNMIVGSRQSTIHNEDGVEYLMMCHHPYSWLVNEDELKQLWLNRARIQLFGHKHNQHINRIDNSLVISAGAMHPDRREPNWIPRYNLLDISVFKDSQENRFLKVKVWPRIWIPAEQKFSPEYTRHPTSKEPIEYKEFDLPIEKWLGEEYLKTYKTSIPEITVKSNNTSPDEELSTLQLDPIRELTYKFLRLPFYKRIIVGSNLGLWRDEDEGLLEADLFRQFFKRVKESNRLSDFWIEVQKANGKTEFTDNPF